MTNEVVISESYNKAVALHRKIIANAQSAQESLYEVCKGLKEMRDGKLYKELGYRNLDEYAESEVGMSRRNVQRYISVAEMYESGTPVSQNIGVAKLYLLSTLSEEERSEIIDNSSVEEMSKRELEYKISEIRSLQARLDDTDNALRETANEKKKLAEKNAELEQQIEKLEKRPVEVAIKDNSEELERLRAEYEEKLAQAEKSAPEKTAPDTKEVFKAYLSNAVDAASRLLSYVKQHPDQELFITKTKEFFSTVIVKMEE